MSDAMDDKFFDRDGWQPGPWDNEPDRVEWRYKGLPCLIVRGPVGALCGYVGLPVGHPWRDKDWSSIPADVHGGLTYGPEACAGRICHVPKPGESDDVRWIGFDCAHSGDMYPPRMVAGAQFPSRTFYNDTYKTIEYVRKEVQNLAEQALAVMDGPQG